MSSLDQLNGLGDVLDDLVRQRVAAAVESAIAQLRADAPEVDGALRVANVAAVLDIGETSVRNLIAGGELATVDIAGITHVRTSEINRYLDDLTDRARTRSRADAARAELRRRGRRPAA